MQCFITVSATIRGIWDQPDTVSGMLFKCGAEISLNIIHRAIQGPLMLVAQSFGQVNFSDVHKSGTIICPEGS
jgi:hypothetical protein